MRIPEFSEIVISNDQTDARYSSLNALRELVGNAYPNKFQRSSVTGSEDTISGVLDHEPIAAIADEMRSVVAALQPGERPPAEVKNTLNQSLGAIGTVRIAGRLTTPPRGNFVHLTDGRRKLQIYAKKGTFALIRNDADLTQDDENGWTAWQLLDHGDFVGVEGYLFITNTGELSVHVEKLQFLAKSMLPMPDKMHGIEDPEIKQRQRYVDLIGSSLAVEHEGLTTREVFERRAKIISETRRFLEDHGYVEVETPMLTPKATGAAARPFETHHNALDIKLYARIAPELYLKRLVVGGFEKVYELNRNFRNEGLSYKHNPEFTMLEFYCAYMDADGIMDFCEELLRNAVRKATGSLKVPAKQVKGRVPMQLGGMLLNVYDNQIDFASFSRMTMKEAVIKYSSFAQSLMNKDVATWLEEGANVEVLSDFLWWVDNDLTNEVMIMDEKGDVVGQLPEEETNWIIANSWESLVEKHQGIHLTEKERDRGLLDLFEDFVEERLIHPTFITDYPKSISPLSKASPADPAIAERFELFINGMEVANGFSELNDPREQYERFIDQMAERERGDDEAMVLDEDYIRALSYGMPPAAGIGIGIDRLVMLLTNKHSIRDVILFPHMRPERKPQEDDDRS